jgi:hypothetical protein
MNLLLNVRPLKDGLKSFLGENYNVHYYSSPRRPGVGKVYILPNLWMYEFPVEELKDWENLLGKIKLKYLFDTASRHD